MPNNTQEKREPYYLLSWKEDHGLIFQICFFLRLFLQSQAGGFSSRLSPVGFLKKVFNIFLSVSLHVIHHLFFNYLWAIKNGKSSSYYIFIPTFSLLQFALITSPPSSHEYCTWSGFRVLKSQMAGRDKRQTSWILHRIEALLGGFENGGPWQKTNLMNIAPGRGSAWSNPRWRAVIKANCSLTINAFSKLLYMPL